MSSLLLACGLILASCGDDDLNVYYSSVDGVTLKSFGPCPLTRGETMDVIGDNLGKVTKVLFPQGNTKVHDGKSYCEATFTTDGENMTVTVPADAVPGKLRLVIGNDTLVSKSDITFEEEAKITNVSYPDGELRGGDIITITGEYVWNIVSLSFEKNVTVYAEDFLVNTRGEVQVPIPAEARSGAVTYNDGNSLGEEKTLIENINIKNATVASVSPESYELGDELTITGTNLDLIQYASFPGLPKDSVDVDVNEAGTELKVVIPAKTYPGELNLMQYNGIAVPIESFSPVMVTVTGISPKEDLNAGDEVTITGTHFEKVQYITLPGGIALASDEYESTSTTITFTVPEGMGDGEIALVQHSNYSVNTEKVEMHVDSEKQIWAGNCVVGDWKGSMEELSGGKYDWSSVTVGQVMSIYLTMNAGADYSQLRVGNGSWAALPGTSVPYSIDESTTVVRITLTEAMISEMVNNGGLVLCGANFTVTKVTLSVLETQVWKGEQDLGSWSVNYEITGDCFKGNAAAGKILRIYVDAYADWSQIQLFDGYWGKLEFEANSNSNNFNSGMDQWKEHPTYYQVKLTASEAERLNTYTDWGYCMIVQGESCTLKKITIE